ncbi:hypothetical protein Fuma_00764 [Fuerstiella marisgermanici]|uniref:Uncharacterized protein n=1 Tax=Fuerstiella marisgermanici TaxID=1891926 RepID=A0A1P8WAT5_9PLAN|nr:hypothetical protein Fuma_00764 [Fuerstiella marisgermanici]
MWEIVQRPTGREIVAAFPHDRPHRQGLPFSGRPCQFRASWQAVLGIWAQYSLLLRQLVRRQLSLQFARDRQDTSANEKRLVEFHEPSSSAVRT